MTNPVLSLRTNLELNKDNHLFLKSIWVCKVGTKVHKVECKCTKVQKYAEQVCLFLVESAFW